MTNKPLNCIGINPTKQQIGVHDFKRHMPGSSLSPDVQEHKIATETGTITNNTTQIDNHTLANLLLCTFRYSLGRMTYITSDCESWLRRYWHLLPFCWRARIHTDIRRAIEQGCAGHKCDVDSWKKVLELPLEDQP